MYLLFHIMMCFFSTYILQIFFDWKELNLDHDSWIDLRNTSKNGFIFKSINSLIFLGVYFWTFFAPGVL